MITAAQQLISLGLSCRQVPGEQAEPEAEILRKRVEDAALAHVGGNCFLNAALPGMVAGFRLPPASHRAKPAESVYNVQCMTVRSLSTLRSCLLCLLKRTETGYVVLVLPICLYLRWLVYLDSFLTLAYTVTPTYTVTKPLQHPPATLQLPSSETHTAICLYFLGLLRRTFAFISYLRQSAMTRHPLSFPSRLTLRVMN